MTYFSHKRVYIKEKKKKAKFSITYVNDENFKFVKKSF